MGVVIDTLSWILILAGSAFAIIGGIGLLRFPDFFTRIHAAGITDTLCAPLIIGGLMLQSGFTFTTMKLVFLVVFLFLTSPTASHALAKAALHGGVKPLLAHGELPKPLDGEGEPGAGSDDSAEGAAPGGSGRGEASGSGDMKPEGGQ